MAEGADAPEADAFPATAAARTDAGEPETTRAESVADGGSTMPDKSMSACVLRAFHGLSFPQPEGGKVIVTYPIMFSPGGEERPDYGTLTVPKTQTQPRDAAKPSSPLGRHRGLRPDEPGYAPAPPAAKGP